MLTLFLWLLSAVAMAESPPVVDALWSVDADGVLTSVKETGEAFVVRGAVQEPLAVGTVLSTGELVRTNNARVRIRMDSDQQIVLGEDSILRLDALEGERTVYQQAGDIFYRVRGYFKVSYGTVEAAVEGTEFIVRIAADGTVSVEVLQGVVRVSEERGEVVVQRGEGSQVAPNQPPATPLPLPRGTDDSSATNLRTNLGAPRASISALLGVASSEDGNGFLPNSVLPDATIRIIGRYRLTPGLRLTADTGIVTGSGRFFLPQSVGIERRLAGPLSLGASAVALIGGMACTTGTDIRLGAAATAALRLPITYTLSLDSLARLGTTASLRTDATPELLYDLALGVRLGF
ncbi:MAG: hypothetical protein ACI8RZ_001449 [Myxococcota bacterium]|jgi:hypothetical protein